MLEHQKHDFKNRMDQLFYQGSVTVQNWEEWAWYGPNNESEKRLLLDVQSQINEMYNSYYGFDGAEDIMVSIEYDRTLFLRSESLMSLEEQLRGLI